MQYPPNLGGWVFLIFMGGYTFKNVSPQSYDRTMPLGMDTVYGNLKPNDAFV